jgi:hypothetical protein
VNVGGLDTFIDEFPNIKLWFEENQKHGWPSGKNWKVSHYRRFTIKLRQEKQVVNEKEQLVDYVEIIGYPEIWTTEEFEIIREDNDLSEFYTYIFLYFKIYCNLCVF